MLFICVLYVVIILMVNFFLICELKKLWAIISYIDE